MDPKTDPWSPDDSWLAWLAPLAPCALSAMGELSSLTGDVGPAFPVVIPVGRAGTAVEEAVDAATTTTPAKVSEEGPEAEAAMWKVRGPLRRGPGRRGDDEVTAGRRPCIKGSPAASCSAVHQRQRFTSSWARPRHGRAASGARLWCWAWPLGHPTATAPGGGTCMLSTVVECDAPPLN
ncbi:unnamed protein product [Durusdinium trenchii]|uniref:Secreted protein n=1 Tax=Durusdinium trenchii TaxID=1381693 RepID=A0ABP0SN19_9DINO